MRAHRKPSGYWHSAGRPCTPTWSDDHGDDDPSGYQVSERGDPDGDDRVCVECGNDLATYGYALCSDCLQELSGYTDPKGNGRR